MSLDKSESGWRVTGVSLRGTAHEKTAQPCQDACFWRLVDGVLVAAVADGAGSAALAEVGASAASEASVTTLAARISMGLPRGERGWKRALKDAFLAAQAAVERESAVRSAPPRELATTLIAAAATDEIVAVAQVGDGAAVLQDASDELIALTFPLTDEYVNQTVFLTAPDALHSAQVRVWRGEARHLALFSDGIQRLALQLPQGAPHAPFFAPLFAFSNGVRDQEDASRQLREFLRSPRVLERTDDDLTLLLATLER